MNIYFCVIENQGFQCGEKRYICELNEDKWKLYNYGFELEISV